MHPHWVPWGISHVCRLQPQREPGACCEFHVVDPFVRASVLGMLRYVCLAWALLGCASTPPPSPAHPEASKATVVPTVTREEAHALVQRGAKLVDVRSAAEYDEKHIDGAINIPVDELASRAGELGSKDQPVVLYCKSGRRADRAAESLRGAGYTKVETLGGMENW